MVSLKQGYQTENNTCVDVDECENEFHECPFGQPSAKCINQNGNYTCDCPQGYRLIN